MKKIFYKIITKKIIPLIMLLIQFFTVISNVQAANIGETKSLERGELGYYCVQKWDGNKWIYLTYNQTFYTDLNGEKHIAYCLSPGLPGVGYVSGEKENYNVKIKEILKDNRVWRVMKNGYPYKSVEELGLETSDDAYFATMQAINCILRGYTLEQAKQLYTPGQFAINGENLQDIQRRGTKTLNVMFNLINTGLNGTEIYNNMSQLSVKKTTSLVKEKDNYYSISFKVESKSEISEYEINGFEEFPEGSYISDLNGNKKTKFKKGENFKVMIKTNKIISDIKGKITVKAQQKNYPIFYSSSLLEGFQDYALSSNPYSEVYTTADVYEYSNKSKLIINKVDSETNKPIPNVKFQIINSKGEKTILSTDKNGKIILANQYQGEFTIKEIETIEKYRLNSKEIKEFIEFNETKEIEIKNELKKGNIKVIKVDEDNEKIKLENVKFQLINEKGEIVKEEVTNKQGEILFKNLLIGKYTIKEVGTLNKYKLLKETITVEVKDKKTEEIIVKNKLKKGNVKIIKVDKDDRNIKIENVRFQIINEKGEVVKEGITNNQGEVVFNNLLIGKYKIYEVETAETYILNEECINIEVKDGETNEIIITNTKKELPKTGNSTYNLNNIINAISISLCGIALLFNILIEKNNLH